MAAIAGFYRRNLPSPPAIEFASLEGKLLFVEALAGRNMEGFFKLISYYQTQSEPAYCGLATLSMVLNALAVDPGRKWKGPWRWFDDSMLDCCEPLEKVKVTGISFDKVACLAHCNGAEVKELHTNESTLEDFRSYVISCTSSEDRHLIVSYHRGHFKQTGSGHFSPIGGYHAGRDLVLVLDVARFKYPPHWVPLTLLWEAMDTVDEETGRRRGFMILARPQRAPSILYTVNCRHKSWEGTAKYLTKDLPRILSSEEIIDVQELLVTVMSSAPADLRDFVNWVAGVRLQEEGSKLTEEEKARLSLKEEVLNQVHMTDLFEHVTKFRASKTCCKISSEEKDSLATIVSEVCCQGAQIFCGRLGSFDMPSCKATNTRNLKDSDHDKPTVVNTGEMDTKTTERGFDVLIPYCQIYPDGCPRCASSSVGRMHPSVNDVVTILLLALPPQTWSNISHEDLKEEINRLTSTADLPSLLQEEVMHLRQQLHFVSRSVCSCSP
uniref:glutathione gamma-glutamylcysteinyltransferase n=1 Tax=Fagopyrum esculentum TaxID=3617 RepID=A7M779_FAGES|nr:phytochelatin synthase [Fagopyrum esculentum]